MTSLITCSIKVYSKRAPGQRNVNVTEGGCGMVIIESMSRAKEKVKGARYAQKEDEI